MDSASVVRRMAELTREDVDKPVITAAGKDRVGVVTDVDEDGGARVEAENEVADEEASLLFGGTEGTGHYLHPSAISAVNEEAVVLDNGMGVEFQQRNVAADADHELEFYGAYGYVEDGQKHVVERQFHVYLDDEDRRDGKPVVVVPETHLVDVEDVDTEKGTRERRIVDEETHEFVVDIDADEEIRGTRLEETHIEEYCGAWHVEHATRK